MVKQMNLPLIAATCGKLSTVSSFKILINKCHTMPLVDSIMEFTLLIVELTLYLIVGMRTQRGSTAFACYREIKKNFSERAMNEALYFLPRIEADMKGTPETNPGNYINYSPYTHRAEDGGNVKYPLNVAVRLHHNPDIVWRLENRRRTFLT